MSAATDSSRQHEYAATVFLRHLGEMTLAMFVGMSAFGLTLGAIDDSVRVSQPELFMTGMAAAMSATMVAWMRHRRHNLQHALEMSAAMLVPVVGVLVCYRAGASLRTRCARFRAH